MTKKELRKISLQFRTLSSQMLKIDSEEEITHIQAFFDFITKNELISDYVRSCHKQEYNFDELFSNLSYHQKLILPSEQNELIDFGYQLLQYMLQGKRRLSFFGRSYTSSNKYADMINAFMRKVIEPFVVTLRTFLELSMIDSTDDEESTFSAEQVTVFLSYCQKDSDIADLIDSGLKQKHEDKIHISRDIRDVAFHESFKQFMQTIQDHDYVIILISDRYMKSRNCMFEVLETIKDTKYQDRLLYIVLQDEDKKYLPSLKDELLGADVYSNEGQTKYIVYWKHREEEIQQQINEIGDTVSAINQIKEMKIVKKILLELPDFLDFIRDSKGLSLSTHVAENYASMSSFMKVSI